MVAENVFSGKGSAEASPCKTSPFALWIRARSPAAKAWLYSMLVTRPACFRNSSVAAPGPDPISRTCSPKSVPVKSQGISCFRVMRRQYAEVQNQFSNRFTETRPIRRARKAGANRERPHTLSRCDYRRPARNLAIEEARGFSGAGFPTSLKWDLVRKQPGAEKYIVSNPGAPESVEPTNRRELMAPVKFANACAACHSLSFDERFDFGVPHDEPEIVHTFLVAKFTE
jgi:hypothetical protein